MWASRPTGQRISGGCRRPSAELYRAIDRIPRLPETSPNLRFDDRARRMAAEVVPTAGPGGGEGRLSIAAVETRPLLTGRTQSGVARRCPPGHGNLSGRGHRSDAAEINSFTAKAASETRPSGALLRMLISASRVRSAPRAKSWLKLLVEKSRNSNFEQAPRSFPCAVPQDLKWRVASPSFGP